MSAGASTHMEVLVPTWRSQYYSNAAAAGTSTHMQVPDAYFPVQTARGHQAGDGGVKGHAPGGPAVPNKRVEALPRLHLRDVDVVVDVGGGHEGAGGQQLLDPTRGAQH